jgi:hypothetical protein
VDQAKRIHQPSTRPAITERQTCICKQAADAVAAGWENNGRVSLQINGGQDVSVSASPVPEPATLLLLGTGLIGLARAPRKVQEIKSQFSLLHPKNKKPRLSKIAGVLFDMPINKLNKQTN